MQDVSNKVFPSHLVAFFYFAPSQNCMTLQCKTNCFRLPFRKRVCSSPLKTPNLSGFDSTHPSHPNLLPSMLAVLCHLPLHAVDHFSKITHQNTFNAILLLGFYRGLSVLRIKDTLLLQTYQQLTIRNKSLQQHHRRHTLTGTVI